MGAVEEGEEQAPAELEAHVATLSRRFPPGTSFNETTMHARQLSICMCLSILKRPLALAIRAELPVRLVLEITGANVVALQLVL